MAGIPKDKLEKMVGRWSAIQAELNAGVNQAAYAKLTKEFAALNPLVATIEALRAADKEHADLKALIGDPSSDKEMIAMARADLEALEPRREELEQQLKIQLLPKDAADERSAILEVRAGTGGDEAALFAADLFRMYSRYAELRGWKVEIISISENDLGGYKEIVASISGEGVFARLKFESGVHRVQRIPDDRDGRAHPHVGGDGRRAARGRGSRRRYPARGRPHRHDARGRRRRPARQQDGFGRAHDAFADRHHRRLGREVAAPEPPPRHAGAALARLRAGARAGRLRARSARARARSARAIARSASAPTTSRRGASPTIAST